MNAMTAAAQQLHKIEKEEISLVKLKKLSSQFIDGTLDGFKTLSVIYPKHIYYPLRRKLAVELAGKEVAKILDAEGNTELDRLRQGVEKLYDGREGVYAHVHDFWSFVEMILHVKKKELPELITAQNVIWDLEDMPLDQLHITWMPFLEKRQDVFGHKPWQIADLQRIFFQQPALFEAAQKEQQEVVGDHQHNFDESAEPIALVFRKGELELIDGNGRLYRALLDGSQSIKCYIGRLHGAMPLNYWVGAGTLKQFCLEIRGYAEVDLEGFANGLSYLRTKLRNNTPALINYELFLRSDFPEFEESLKGILPAQ